MKKIILILVCFSIVSCSAALENKETKEGSNLSSSKTSDKKTLMSVGTYDIVINTSITCKGSGVQINLYSNQSISLTGSADCGFLGSLAGQRTIDLAKIFPYTNLEEDPSTPEVNAMKGVISRSKNTALTSDGSLPIGGFTFTPARPNIINPLANVKNLEDMEEEYQEYSTATVRIPDGTIMNDEGVFGVKVTGISKEPPSGTTKIETQKGNRIIQSRIRVVKGFNNIPQRGMFMLFETRDMWMGTAPVAIYKMQVSSRLNDMMKGMSDTLIKAIATNGGQNKTTSTFYLKSFSVASDEDDEDDDDDEDDEDDEDEDEDEDEDDEDEDEDEDED